MNISVTETEPLSKTELPFRPTRLTQKTSFHTLKEQWTVVGGQWSVEVEMIARLNLKSENSNLRSEILSLATDH